MKQYPHMKLFAAALAVAAVFSSSVPAAAYTQEQQWELNVGQQEYQQLQKQGVLLTSSPLYAKLDPIAHRIAAVADKQYYVPFRFYLVKNSQPNAFSVPGGHVYVTTAMMSFAQNEQELAGVLCHEVSHDLHHDVYNLAIKNQNLSIGASLLGLLIGNNAGWAQNLIGLGANLESLNFSRAVESNADHTGAYVCAQAGENPWGMVWLFKRFETKPTGVPLEMLSDHPRDDHRVADLENLFRSDPATFGRFSPDPRTATAL
jgi:predicted Zn-dependent protease